MSLEMLLDHTCNIYHIIESAKSPGYSLASSPYFKYLESPDISGIACHFGIDTNSVTIKQTEPQNIMEARIKLTLPIGTHVRRGDKIVDCTTGLEYTAEQPQNIRNHHVFVFVQRVAQQRAL